MYNHQVREYHRYTILIKIFYKNLLNHRMLLMSTNDKNRTTLQNAFIILKKSINFLQPEGTIAGTAIDSHFFVEQTHISHSKIWMNEFCGLREESASRELILIQFCP